MEEETALVMIHKRQNVSATEDGQTGQMEIVILPQVDKYKRANATILHLSTEVTPVEETVSEQWAALVMEVGLPGKMMGDATLKRERLDK